MSGKYLSREVHDHDLHADLAEALRAWVNIVQPRFHGLKVPTEFLVHPLEALGHNFVRVVYKAAADAGSPCAHAAAALSPAVHAPAVERDFLIRPVFLGQDYVVWLPVQPLFLVHLIKYLCRIVL